MKCPSCGKEIEPGHLYCETCGLEIRIVPDFEPEIENSITETLSTVGEEIQRKENEQQEQEKDDREQESFFLEEMNRSRLRSRIISLAAALIAIAVAIPLLYIHYSASYQTQKAEKLASQGKYQEAAELLEKAGRKDGDVIQNTLLLASCYEELGDSEKTEGNFLLMRWKSSMKEQSSFMKKRGALTRLTACLRPARMKVSAQPFSIIWHFPLYITMRVETMMRFFICGFRPIRQGIFIIHWMERHRRQRLRLIRHRSF